MLLTWKFPAKWSIHLCIFYQGFLVEINETILTITWMYKEFKIAKNNMENKEYGRETCTSRFHDLKLHQI